MLKTQYFNAVSCSPGYRDYRPLANDRVILRNPHKGFYMHYVDNGFGSPLYRNCLANGDFLADFPGFNHLYLRFDWADIETQEGVYDWTPIDEIMALWGRQGYRFSLRLCTYEGTDGKVPAEIPTAVPLWVWQKGARHTRHQDVFEPDYSDDVYMNHIERFLAAYGKKFNGDRRIEFIDVGTFGTWGEGHTFAGNRRTYDLETLYRHIVLHRRYFPDTMILVNDDLINHRTEIDIHDTLALSELCAGLGMGIRDDSILVPYYAENMGYNSLKSPFMFDRIWRHAPVDLERAHYRPEQAKNEGVFAAALADAHASFAGFHGDPRLWLDNQLHLTERLANQLGYWYFLEGINLPEAYAGMPAFADLYFTNRGFAPAYCGFTLRVKLTGKTGAGQEIPAGAIDNRRWGDPGQLVCEHVRLDLRDVQAGDYLFSIGLFEGDRPIQLALDPQICDAEGFYQIDRLTVNA